MNYYDLVTAKSRLQTIRCTAEEFTMQGVYSLVGDIQKPEGKLENIVTDLLISLDLLILLAFQNLEQYADRASEAEKQQGIICKLYGLNLCIDPQFRLSEDFIPQRTLLYVGYHIQDPKRLQALAVLDVSGRIYV